MVFNIIKYKGYKCVKASKKNFKNISTAMKYKNKMSQKKGKLHVVDLKERYTKDIIW